MDEVRGAGATGLGIVHLGAGAFARGLPWWATASAVDTEPGPWSVLAVARRSHVVVDALARHDWRYRVRSLGPGQEHTEAVGILAGGLVAAEDPTAVVAALADPEVRIVTVTATEAAYAAPVPGAPDGLTPAAQLLAAARERLAVGAPALSVVSCDNVASGSQVLRRLTVERALAANDDDAATELGRWRWPVSVVDRVVPRVDPAREPDVDVDAWWRWVLQDDFAGARPAWERVGVRLVTDTGPWERAKLLLVNAPHSLLALLGLTRGHQSVEETMTDPLVSDAVEALLGELLPDVPAAPGLDPATEAERTVRRFSRQRVRHLLTQIGAEGSTKLPQRLAPTWARVRGDDGEATWSTLTVALWVRALDRGLVNDGAADAVRATADRKPRDRAAVLLDLLGMGAGHPDPVRDQLTAWLDQLTDRDDRDVHRAVADRLG